MTVRELLLNETNAEELCVIRNAGYIVEVAYIDHEDLFIGNINHAYEIVKSDGWGYLETYTPGNLKKATPVHYIDI